MDQVAIFQLHQLPNMNIRFYQQFAQLCESLVFEASTTGNIINSLPGGVALMKKLHTMGLAHDQEYQLQPRIEWNKLKDYSYGGWVILEYPKGVGAIHQKRGEYTAVASPASPSVDPETGVVSELETFENSRGGNILEFLKRTLGGNPKKLYIGSDNNKVKDKQSQRKKFKDITNNAMTSEKLVIKFKPLWVRAATAAIADIKGMASSMLKNDAFEKASNKINVLTYLTAALDQFEKNPESIPDIFLSAAQKAVMMSAYYYYPDESGQFTRSYRGYSLEDPTGTNHLLQDIANGDTTKMGTVLTFFKRNLLNK
jgi:hypothetical protein